MQLKKIKIENTYIKWLLRIIAIFFVLAVFSSISFFLLEKKYNNKIYPGINLGDINLGGLTKEEAKSKINDRINKINKDGIIINYNDEKITIKPSTFSLNPELAHEIIRFDVDSSINKIYEINRNNNIYKNTLNKIVIAIKGKQAKIDLSMNENEINTILFNSFKAFNRPAKNAELVAATSSKNELISFSIKEEKFGKIIDFKKGIKNLGINLLDLNNSSINLLSITEYPSIYKKEILNIESKANKTITLSPIIFKYNKKEWEIKKNTLLSWLILERGNNNSKNIVVSFKADEIKKYLINEVAPNIDKKPINGKFKKENNKVIEFKASTDGQVLDIEKNTNIIKRTIDEEQNVIELSVDILKSAYGTEEINNVGIREIIGTGYSNFSGSPSNRRHNIKTGATSVGGLLIEPDEEFSLVKALGEIEASTGYLPELVIKGNETIPEYGGGLCQVATTLFRAATESGLPITARRNHSYRVSYYEPAGTDASIYDPWPDFKFLNDTGNHILIQARIEGSEIYFDFWGTRDGRKVTKTKPTIYNIVKPETTKLIETLDLAIGEKKCTESAHNGADAYFDYTVLYKDGELKEKRFDSHYIPWQEVCLIGVEELSEESEEDENKEEKEIIKDGEVKGVEKKVIIPKNNEHASTTTSFL